MVLPAPAASASRPLVVTTDELLLDELLRLLAAAGCTPERAAGGGPLRRAYRDAPVVLLGADALAAAPVRALPRRPGLLVVVTGEPEPDVWAAAVDVGAERVVVLPRDELWLVERIATATQAPIRPGWLAVVGGCCGGAGASTVATALARAAAPAAAGVLLVDGDGWGGGLDLLLGAERAQGLRWPDLSGLSGRIAGGALVAALPVAGGVRVLAASRDAPAEVGPEVLSTVVRAARDGGHDVVLDLPSNGAPAVTVLDEADLAVLLVPARLRAVAAARALLTAGGWAAARVVSRPVPGGLSRRDVAEVLARGVFAELGHDRSVAARGERGEPPSIAARSPLGVLSRQLLADLSRRRAA